MGKVKSLKEVMRAVASARKDGRIVVSTNGCFDLLHIGHVRYLYAAKKLGDLLIVGINSDVSVRANKGSTRPIVSEKERAEIIAALEPVDYVFIFSEETPLSWIKKLRPDIHVKGGGSDIKKHPMFRKHKNVMEDIGGKFVLMPHTDGKSTTRIVNKILRK